MSRRWVTHKIVNDKMIFVFMLSFAKMKFASSEWAACCATGYLDEMENAFHNPDAIINSPIDPIVTAIKNHFVW